MATGGAFRTFLVALILTAVVLAFAPGAAEAQVSCGTVLSKLAPCISYASNPTIRLPSAQCCSGVRDLNGFSRTPLIRRGVCACLKNLASHFNGGAVRKAGTLPYLCRVPVPYAISPTTDCARLG